MSFRVVSEYITLKKVEYKGVNDDIFYVIHYEDDDEESHTMKTKIDSDNFKIIMTDLKKIQEDIIIGEPFETKCVLVKFYMGNSSEETDEDEVPQWRIISDDSWY